MMIYGNFEANRTVFKGKIMKMGMQTQHFIKEMGFDRMKNLKLIGEKNK